MHRVTHRSVLILCSALSTACYAYVAPPTGGTSALVGRSAQAALTDSGAVVLAAQVGPAIDLLRGSVVASGPGSVTLAMDEVVRRDGTGMTWRHEVVDVPRPLISRIEVREFSPTRTVLFSAITGTVLFAIERGFLKSGGSNAPGTSQTGTPSGK